MQHSHQHSALSQRLLRINLYAFMTCIVLFILGVMLSVAVIGYATRYPAPLPSMLGTVGLWGIGVLPFVHLILLLFQPRAIRQLLRRTYALLVAVTTVLCGLYVSSRIIFHQLEAASFDKEVEAYQVAGLGLMYMPFFILFGIALIVLTFMFLEQAKEPRN